MMALAPPVAPKVGSLNWRNIIFFSIIHILALAGVAYAILYPMWQTLALAALWYFFRVSAIAFGYHKYYNHETYDCAPALQFYYLFWGATAFQNAISWWSPVHSEHHRDTDGPADFHSIKHGFWHAHCGWLMRHSPPPPQKLADRVRKKPMVEVQERFLLPIAVGAGFFLPALIATAWADPMGGFLIAGPVALVIAWHRTWWVNSGAHYFGEPTYDANSTARNGWLSALVTGLGHGGGHSFHHEFPYDYRDHPEWRAYDPAKWWIYGLSLMGITWNLKRAPDARITAAKERAAVHK